MSRTTCALCGWRVRQCLELDSLDMVSRCMGCCSKDCLLSLAHRDPSLVECIAALQKVDVPYVPPHVDVFLTGSVDEAIKIVTVFAKCIYSSANGVGNRGYPYDDNGSRACLSDALYRLGALDKSRYMESLYALAYPKAPSRRISPDPWNGIEPRLAKALFMSRGGSETEPIDI